MNEQPESTPEPKASRATKYHVLKEDDNGAWEGPVGTFWATTGQAAVSAYLKTIEDPAGIWVSVPVRSWKPITVEVETQTKLKFT